MISSSCWKRITFVGQMKHALKRIQSRSKLLISFQILLLKPFYVNKTSSSCNAYDVEYQFICALRSISAFRHFSNSPHILPQLSYSAPSSLRLISTFIPKTSPPFPYSSASHDLTMATDFRTTITTLTYTEKASFRNFIIVSFSITVELSSDFNLWMMMISWSEYGPRDCILLLSVIMLGILDVLLLQVIHYT